MVRVEEVPGEVDPPLRAGDGRGGGQVCDDRAAQQRGGTGVPPQQHPGVQVDTLRGQQRVGLHPVRFPQQQLGERHRVDPEVQQRPAAQRGVAQAVLGPEGAREAEVGLHRADLTDRAVPHQLGDPADQRVAVRPHGLHQEQPALPGQSGQLPRLTRVERERLLAQDVLAGLQGEPGRLPVRRVRGCDVHDVDGVVRDELRPAAVRPLDPEPVGEGPRGGLGTGGDGHDLGPGVRHRQQVLGEPRGYAARRQNTPTHSPAHAARPHTKVSTTTTDLRA